MFSLAWSIFYVHGAIERFDPSILSWIGSIILVIAGYNFFQVTITAFKDRKWGIFVPFALCSIITMGSLMFCTFQGIYENRSKQIAIAKLNDGGQSKARQDYNDAEADIKRLESDLELQKKSLTTAEASLSAVISAGKLPGTAEYNRAHWPVQDIQDTIQKDKNKIEDLGKIKTDLSHKFDMGAERGDFYGALAKSWGGSGDDWEFRFNLAIAFVIDSVGPLGMAVSIFL